MGGLNSLQVLLFVDMSFALFSLVSSSIRGLTWTDYLTTICHRGSMVHQTRDATHLVVMVVLLFLLRLHGTMVTLLGIPVGKRCGIQPDVGKIENYDSDLIKRS